MFKYICCSTSTNEVKTNEIILSENELNLLNNAYKNLNNINDKEIPYFSFKGHTFFAKPCNIYDGDTFSVIFLFENKLIKYKCRCLGYDTAEIGSLWMILISYNKIFIIYYLLFIIYYLLY